MSTFNSSRHNKLFSDSPNSSSDSNEEFQATPDTRLTAFSPDDRSRRVAQMSDSIDPADTMPKTFGVNVGGAPLTAGHHDPFVTTNAKNKEVKLSATASAFEPFGIQAGPSNAATRVRSSSSTPGTLEYLQKETLNAGEVNQFGTFTTDTGASRCMKATSLYGLNAQKLVETSLAKLEQSEGFVRKGAEPRVVPVNSTTVYIRESNIADASRVYTSLKIDNLDHLEVSYVSPSVYGKCVSPAAGAISSHEGQIYLEVTYPVGTSIIKRDVEKVLVNLLSVEGALCAWQKIPSTQEGVFRLLAEFYDASCAPRAVQRLNQMKIDGIGAISISAKQHTPDALGLPKSNLSPAKTPTRQSTDRVSRLSDQLGHMGIRRTTSSEQGSSLPNLSSPNAATYTSPTSSSRPSPYGHMLNRSPNSIDRSNAYSTTMAMHRTPGSINRSHGFTNVNGNILTPNSADRPSTYLPPSIGGGLAYLPANSFSMPQGMPVMFSGVYTAPTLPQQHLMTPTHLSATAMQAMNQHLYASPPMYPYPGLDSSNISPVAFQQQSMGMGFSPATPNNTRELSPFSRSGSGGRRQNAIKVPPHARRHHPNPAAGQHNHVDISRIQEGMDVRTTVMLRNIPNKVDQAMLKEIVDESSFGRYDFMYLRIDFSNNCNVGYAFINFVDPLDIVQFVEARSNQKWHRFKSDKVAEVSYATIQGRDCLIQKFRNSSVMLEPPHYRPKLFFTFHDPLGRAGMEDEFPNSDNASKLKRSCENAEHVGLFAPSAGQHLRDEQRRRRSQYDRGTSLAEREEYDFEILEPFDNTQGLYNFHPYGSV